MIKTIEKILYFLEPDVREQIAQEIAEACIEYKEDYIKTWETQIAKRLIEECDEYYRQKYGELPIVDEIKDWLDQREES